MKVLITGPEWHDNSPAIASRGFQEIGCETEIFYDNPEDWNLTVFKILNRTPFKKYAAKFDNRYRGIVGQKFLTVIENFQPDFIFVIAGLRFPNKIIWQIRNRYKIQIANFVVDDPAFCARTLFYDLSAYNEIFVIDKSWMPDLEYFNPGHIHPMAHAGDILHCKPLGLKKDVDIAFGGSMGLRMPNGPSGYLRATILNSLAEQGFKIEAFAGGITETFPEFPALKKISYFDGYKSHDDLNKLYNRAKIVLSIHSPQLKSGVSPRVFDAALSGTFQLIEYKPELDELFPKNLIKSFKNTKELVKLADYYLKHDKEREEIAKKTLDWVLKNHQFKNRAKSVLKTCGF